METDATKYKRLYNELLEGYQDLADRKRNAALVAENARLREALELRLHGLRSIEKRQPHATNRARIDTIEWVLAALSLPAPTTKLESPEDMAEDFEGALLQICDLTQPIGLDRRGCEEFNSEVEREVFWLATNTVRKYRGPVAVKKESHV